MTSEGRAAQMTNTRSQVSFEFIMIFALIFLALAGFFYIINERMSELAEKREYNIMRSLASSIINEVVIASSVSNNYMRKFDIPPRILGARYNMTIEEDEIAIRLIEGDMIKKEYYAAFPIPVKGTFIENINSSIMKASHGLRRFRPLKSSSRSASKPARDRSRIMPKPPRLISAYAST